LTKDRINCQLKTGSKYKKKTNYSDEFKRPVDNEVNEGILKKEEARIKYGIKGNTAIFSWII